MCWRLFVQRACRHFALSKVIVTAQLSYRNHRDTARCYSPCRRLLKTCCVYDWYHLAQTNEALHHRVLRLHTFFVEYKQRSGSVAVCVTAEVTQSALTDTGANGTLLSSTGSIKISSQTAGDPRRAVAFLTCSAAPVGARSADSANQLHRSIFFLPVSGLYHNSSQVMRLFHPQVHSCTTACSRSRRQLSYCRQRETERSARSGSDYAWSSPRLPAPAQTPRSLFFFFFLSLMLASTREKIVPL